MSWVKLFGSITAAWIAACGLAPAVAAASPSPAPIGDGCLIGRWVETKEAAPGNWTWVGEVMPVSGFRGLVITFAADGTETDDLGAAEPLIGDYHGHQVKIVERGRIQFHVHADGSLLEQSAPVGNVQISFYFDGQPAPGSGTYNPGSYTYRCGSTTLHRETAARDSRYGPLVDDLVRTPTAAASNSLPSSVATNLPSPAAVLAAPVTLLVSAIVALAAVLLITFPSHLFNRTYEENHEVIRYWWERRFSWLLRLRLRSLAGSRRSIRDGLGFLAVTVCGGVLAALLDPSFGPNLRTLALFIGAVFALIAGTLIGFGATAGYRLARHSVGPWRLQALPSALLVAAVCVLVSRLTNFQPGYLYGLIGGVAFARELGLRQKGHVAAVTSIVTLVIAFAAWLLWVPVEARSVADPTNFGWALVSNFLAAMFVSGMVGLLIGLVPLRFLPGEKLASWHRGVWGAVFGLAALSVVEVMLRPQSGGTHVTTAPLLTTAALFVGFGIASVSFWAYFRLRTESSSAATPAGIESPDH